MNPIEDQHVENWQKQQQEIPMASEARLANLADGLTDKPLPEGIVYVDVDSLPDTTRVKGIDDFKGDTPEKRVAHYDSLKRDLLHHEQMRPYVERGHGPETWDAWDDQAKIGQASPEGHIRGYADIYKAYYSRSDAIAVSEVNGRYVDILNGEHRIFLARQLGIHKLPVYVDK